MKYVAQIDGLRCVAIIGVIIWHWVVWDTGNVIINNVAWNHGVLLFFVLSGFLITNILLDLKKKVDSSEYTLGRALRVFYIRRALRIFPIYYLLIFWLYYINYKNTQQVFPWLVTYTSNLYMAFKADFLGDFTHFWSLAIEEQFYIIWPLLILLVPRKHVFKTIIAVILISLFSRMTCVIFYKDNWMLGSYFSPNLFLSFGIGGVLSYYFKYRQELFRRISTNMLLFYGSFLVYYLFYFFLTKKYPVEFLKASFEEYMFCLFAMTFVARAADSNFKFIAKAFLENKVVVYLGMISYGIYVYHMFMIHFFWNEVSPFLHLKTDLKYTYWALYFITLVALASASFYLIEKPINSLKRFFPY